MVCDYTVSTWRTKTLLKHVVLCLSAFFQCWFSASPNACVPMLWQWFQCSVISLSPLMLQKKKRTLPRSRYPLVIVDNALTIPHLRGIHRAIWLAETDNHTGSVIKRYRLCASLWFLFFLLSYSRDSGERFPQSAGGGKEVKTDSNSDFLQTITIYSLVHKHHEWYMVRIPPVNV